MVLPVESSLGVVEEVEDRQSPSLVVEAEAEAVEGEEEQAWFQWVVVGLCSKDLVLSVECGQPFNWEGLVETEMKTEMRSRQPMSRWMG